MIQKAIQREKSKLTEKEKKVLEYELKTLSKNKFKGVKIGNCFFKF